MWHLLKSEWAYRKHLYLISFGPPIFILSFKAMTMITWYNEKLPSRLFAMTIVGILCFTFTEPYTLDNKVRHNGTRVRSLLPITHLQHFLIRLLSGPQLLTLIFTFMNTLYLYILRDYTGTAYWSCLTLGGLLIAGQMLTNILIDISISFAKAAWIGKLFIPVITTLFVPITYIVILVNVPEINFLSFVEAFFAVLLAVSATLASLHIFNRRTSFLG